MLSCNNTCIHSRNKFRSTPLHIIVAVWPTLTETQFLILTLCVCVCLSYQKTSLQRLHCTLRARGSCTLITIGQSAPGHNCNWKWLWKTGHTEIQRNEKKKVFSNIELLIKSQMKFVWLVLLASTPVTTQWKLLAGKCERIKAPGKKARQRSHTSATCRCLLSGHKCSDTHKPNRSHTHTST